MQSNIALAIEANADTQLKGGLLNVFIVLNPGHNAREAQAVFQATLDSVLQNGFDPDLVHRRKTLTIAERLFSADSIDGIGDLAGYTYGIVGEQVLRRRRSGSPRLTGDDLLAAARTYLSRPDRRRSPTPQREPAEGQLAESRRGGQRRLFEARAERPDRRTGLDRQGVATPTTARSAFAPVEFTLSNGLRVIVQRKTDRPTFVISGSIASSPAFAPAGQEGIIAAGLFGGRLWERELSFRATP